MDSCTNSHEWGLLVAGKDRGQLRAIAFVRDGTMSVMKFTRWK